MYGSSPAPDVRVLALVRGAVCVLQDAVLGKQVPRACEALVADGDPDGLQVLVAVAGVEGHDYGAILRKTARSAGAKSSGARPIGSKVIRSKVHREQGRQGQGHAQENTHREQLHTGIRMRAVDIV